MVYHPEIKNQRHFVQFEKPSFEALKLNTHLIDNGIFEFYHVENGFPGDFSKYGMLVLQFRSGCKREEEL